MYSSFTTTTSSTRPNASATPFHNIHHHINASTHDDDDHHPINASKRSLPPHTIPNLIQVASLTNSISNLNASLPTSESSVPQAPSRGLLSSNHPLTPKTRVYTNHHHQPGILTPSTPTPTSPITTAMRQHTRLPSSRMTYDEWRLETHVRLELWYVFLFLRLFL